MDLADIGAERAVLSSLFQYGDEVYVDISDIISASTFTHQNNQILYKCIEKILSAGQVVDLSSLLAASKHLGYYEIISAKAELEYIKSLMELPIKKENTPKFAAQIKKFEFAREIKRIVRGISNDVDKIKGDESVDEILSILEDPITNFLKEDGLGQKTEKIWDGLEEYYEFIQENQCDQVGISSGMVRFDTAIGGGMRRKCVDLVAARPKCGKTIFADNVALNVSMNGTPVLMLDTEMSKEDHINRIIANLSDVPINEFATGKFADDKEKSARVRKSMDIVKKLPYTYASVAGSPFENIVNTIKKWIVRDVGKDENGRVKDCLVVYDYLKLMNSSSLTSHLQEYQVLGFQITALHNLAVKFDFPCLAFVQLNRDGITKESTDAVSGSDRLIWLCTSFSIFKKKSAEEYAEDGPSGGNRKFVTIASRHGPGTEDGDYINMNVVGDRAILREVKSRNELIVANTSGGAIEGADETFEEEGYNEEPPFDADS